VSEIQKKWLSGNEATSAELALSWNFPRWKFSKLMTSWKHRVLKAHSQCHYQRHKNEWETQGDKMQSTAMFGSRFFRL
jgi:hypothetical protein